MLAAKFRTPVVLVIFNRPHTTQEVFNVLKEVKPTKLFVIADGPRVNNQEDIKKCQETRNIIDTISWECEVHKRYANTNIGIRNNFPDGLNWVFEQVTEAIILEDDTVPHLSFFPYCEELLERYKDDERIGMISGYNDQFGRSRTDFSYYFSRHTNIWAWGTWKRAWKYYDVNAPIWSELKNNKWLECVTTSRDEAKHWIRATDNLLNRKSEGWDAQWTVACMSQNMLSIKPNINLVTNIGFDSDSTHNTNSNVLVSRMSVDEINFPLKHPNITLPNLEADIFSARLFMTNSILRRVIRRAMGKSLHKFIDLYQKLPL